MNNDIANFYLNTPLTRLEYLELKMRDIPYEIIKLYNLKKKVTKDASIYVAAKRGMYRLPQAGILAQQLLEKRLNKHGYHQSTLVPGLWTHEWITMQFILVVDDFGVKYTGEEHAKHHMAVLNKDYTITHYWKGAKYVGITLDWDYAEQKVHLSMPG